MKAKAKAKKASNPSFIELICTVAGLPGDLFFSCAEQVRNALHISTTIPRAT
jgi:D-serine dehydratase